MTTHHCNANPAAGKVCSHLATGPILTSLGFPVRVVVKGCFGMAVVEVEGATLEAAKHAATNAGLVRTCSRTAASTR